MSVMKIRDAPIAIEIANGLSSRNVKDHHRALMVKAQIPPKGISARATMGKVTQAAIIRVRNAITHRDPPAEAVAKAIGTVLSKVDIARAARASMAKADITSAPG